MSFVKRWISLKVPCCAFAEGKYGRREIAHMKRFIKAGFSFPHFFRPPLDGFLNKSNKAYYDFIIIEKPFSSQSHPSKFLFLIFRRSLSVYKHVQARRHLMFIVVTVGECNKIVLDALPTFRANPLKCWRIFYGKFRSFISCCSSTPSMKKSQKKWFQISNMVAADTHKGSNWNEIPLE